MTFRPQRRPEPLRFSMRAHGSLQGAGQARAHDKASSVAARPTARQPAPISYMRRPSRPDPSKSRFWIPGAIRIRPSSGCSYFRAASGRMTAPEPEPSLRARVTRGQRRRCWGMLGVPISEGRGRREADQDIKLDDRAGLASFMALGGSGQGQVASEEDARQTAEGAQPDDKDPSQNPGNLPSTALLHHPHRGENHQLSTRPGKSSHRHRSG